MSTIEAYLEYERECRLMAEKSSRPEVKQTFKLIAAAWAKVAADQARLITRATSADKAA